MGGEGHMLDMIRRLKEGRDSSRLRRERTNERMKRLQKREPYPMPDTSPEEMGHSMHHQACRKLAPGLVACGHASGNLIEAVEKPDYPFFLGVQWHPEYLWEQDPAIRQIFEAFVKAADAKRL